MAQIVLTNVNVDFPLYDLGDFSIRRTVFRRAKGLISAVIGGVKPPIEHPLPEHYRTRHIAALRGVSLSLQEGDRVGIVGSNGSGKSTLLRTIAGIYTPSSGRIHTQGSIATLFNIGVGMQEELTGLENIWLSCVLLGLNKRQIMAKLDEIIAFTELEEYLELPISKYSTGMKARLSFAVSTAIEPDILLLDEVIGTGDAHFLVKAVSRIKALMDRARIVVLTSHAESIVTDMCDKAVWIERGVVQCFDKAETVLGAYKHHLIEKGLIPEEDKLQQL